MTWALSIHQRRGGELDRGESRSPHGASRGASTPRLPGYAHLRGQRDTGA
jgi:hypothetical protein